ncbi:MAG: GTP-binding protein [Alphaproteobacteria bacterium]|nr:GTP-binding protein [Alphaproteobacteria bacterium]
MTELAEKLSTSDSVRAIRFAEVVVLVLDASQALESQDLQIAHHVAEEGRALVIAINKWDAVDEKSELIEEIKYRLSKGLAQLRDVRFVPISAINGKNIHRLLDEILHTYALWNIRIKTGGLNRWLAKMESQNPAPLVQSRPNRLKYITQIKTRPPTFALWVSRPAELPDSYRRYIINGIRRDYEIPAVPIRLLVRASKNPFTDKG